MGRFVNNFVVIKYYERAIFEYDRYNTIYEICFGEKDYRNTIITKAQALMLIKKNNLVLVQKDDNGEIYDLKTVV